IKHVIALCNSLIHLETFRNISEKTKAMDTDTLNLVHMYEVALMGTNGEKEEANSGQPLQNKALNFSDTELPQKLQDLATKFHNTFDEFRTLMIELVPLIELVTSIDSDTEETIKEARLKAKESLGDWSKLDAENDGVINSALALLDESFRADDEGLLLKTTTQTQTTSTPIESVSVFDRLHNESTKALSEIKDIISHLFKLLSSLGNLDLESAQHNSGDQIELTELKDLNIGDSIQNNNNNLSRTTDGCEYAQIRNTYAVNILRRVKSKLEGKDFDPVTKMSVEEQVDKMIRQATDIDNLCVMYEGWTPWI
ncbi:1541_t:CDS:2, partial [Ambispora gerdemannii]